MYKHLARGITAIFCLLVFSIAVEAAPVVQKDEAVEPSIIYYGVKTTFNEIETQAVAAPQVKQISAAGLFCDQIITPAIATRGYFDAHTDLVACYNSEAEALKQRAANTPIIAEYASSTSDVPMFRLMSSSTSQRTLAESKMPSASFVSFHEDFAASLKDIAKPKLAPAAALTTCGSANRGTLFYQVGYINAGPDVCTAVPSASIGGVTMESVWLVGGSCAAVNVTMNKYPWPAVQYVDFSSIAYQFLYVAHYNWAPPWIC